MSSMTKDTPVWITTPTETLRGRIDRAHGSGEHAAYVCRMSDGTLRTVPISQVTYREEQPSPTHEIPVHILPDEPSDDAPDLSPSEVKKIEEELRQARARRWQEIWDAVKAAMIFLALCFALGLAISRCSVESPQVAETPPQISPEIQALVTEKQTLTTDRGRELSLQSRLRSEIRASTERVKALDVRAGEIDGEMLALSQ